MGDERHGQGILYLPCGAWYEGNWVHNEMHGEHGKYCFENVRNRDDYANIDREISTKVLLQMIP